MTVSLCYSAATLLCTGVSCSTDWCCLCDHIHTNAHHELDLILMCSLVSLCWHFERYTFESVENRFYNRLLYEWQVIWCKATVSVLAPSHHSAVFELRRPFGLLLCFGFGSPKCCLLGLLFCSDGRNTEIVCYKSPAFKILLKVKLQKYQHPNIHAEFPISE